MALRINKGKAKGTVTAPPSKSMAHRYLICAALSKGSKIGNIAFSKDIEATVNCLKALGANLKIGADTVEAGGIDFSFNKVQELFCNESGSTLRFIIPLCLLFNQRITLTGSERLFSRSLEVYEELCKEQGIEFIKNNSSVTLCGRLKSGKYRVRGDISSQFISGLMFALPLLKDDSEIEIIGKLESASYIEITIKALADFGVRISRRDKQTFYIKGSQTYKKRSLTVEGDYSNAAFFEAMNVLGSDISIEGLDIKSAQGDKIYKELFPLLLKGTPEINLSDCPDLAPVLMVSAAALNGAVFTGTQRLKIKESDRALAMQSELAKFSIKTEIRENSVTVFKGRLKKPSEPIFGHNDHRIVMATAVLLTLVGGEIEGAQAVSKSFPDFFDKLLRLGIEVENYEVD